MFLRVLKLLVLSFFSSSTVFFNMSLAAERSSIYKPKVCILNFFGEYGENERTINRFFQGSNPHPESVHYNFPHQMNNQVNDDNLADDNLDFANLEECLLGDYDEVVFIAHSQFFDANNDGVKKPYIIYKDESIMKKNRPFSDRKIFKKLLEKAKANPQKPSSRTLRVLVCDFEKALLNYPNLRELIPILGFEVDLAPLARVPLRKIRVFDISWLTESFIDLSSDENPDASFVVPFTGLILGYGGSRKVLGGRFRITIKGIGPAAIASYMPIQIPKKFLREMKPGDIISDTSFIRTPEIHLFNTISGRDDINPWAVLAKSSDYTEYEKLGLLLPLVESVKIERLKD